MYSIPKELFVQSYVEIGVELADDSAREETVTVEAGDASSWDMGYFMCAESPTADSKSAEDTKAEAALTPTQRV